MKLIFSPLHLGMIPWWHILAEKKNFYCYCEILKHELFFCLFLIIEADTALTLIFLFAGFSPSVIFPSSKLEISFLPFCLCNWLF